MVDKIRIEKAVKEILHAIGENPKREGLIETPSRVANMYNEIFAGLHIDPLTEAKLFMEEYNDGMVIVKDIVFYSMCEHHLMPFYGNAHVVYMPIDGSVLGLSKIARVVDVISKKPQLQERMCNEIAEAIAKISKSLGVLVLIEAEHLCMTMRGIKKPGAKTVTITSRGILKEDSVLRNEILLLLRK